MPPDPTIYAQFLEWMKVHQIGDLTGIVGLFVTIVGFVATLINIGRSKKAAERAEAAAKDARESILRLDGVTIISAAVTSLEEIVRLHREGQWSIALDRYAHVRRSLAALSVPGTSFGQVDHRVDAALTILRQIETVVDRAVTSKATEKLKAARFNTRISSGIESLLSFLNELKTDTAGM